MKKKQTRLPLYNVNGKTYIGEGLKSSNADFIYAPDIAYCGADGLHVIATESDSEFTKYPFLCPVGKLVGMFTNIRYKYDIPMTKV